MFHALIMAGGTGTRLWPLSRSARPKQALQLLGDRTMFQHAVDRLAPLFPPERIWVVTREEHVDLLAEQVPEMPRENFVVEPEGRGTAPAIGLAAIHLLARDPEATMVVLTADHYIRDTERFRRALAAAEQVAQRGSLVTLGIEPDVPSTGFGYLKQGERLDEVDGFPVFGVERFLEKPDEHAAAKMVASGDHCWNSGMFLWRVPRVLEEFERQMPDFFAQLSRVAKTVGTEAYQETLAQVWPQVAKETIDYGVMEGADDVVVLPIEIGWTDVGSWGALLELLPADQQGNIVRGPHVALDTRNSMLFGQKRLIAALGAEDLIIVDTEDALLICSREREQEVKALVEHLETHGQTEWL